MVPTGGGAPVAGGGEARTEPSIEALLARYSELIDAGDFEGLGRIFAEGTLATADGTPLASGRHEVTALYERTTRRFSDGTPRTKHLVTNVAIEPTNEQADGPTVAMVRSTYLVVQQADPGGPHVVVAAGGYVDQLARDRRGWRFEERRMIPDLFGDVSRHLTFDPGALP